MRRQKVEKIEVNKKKNKSGKNKKKKENNSAIDKMKY